MGEIVNIFDRQVNASASALCHSLGFADRDQYPLTRYVLEGIYRRAFEGPHECRTASEQREDFTGFRQDLEKTLRKQRKYIEAYLRRNDIQPDIMIALGFGQSILPVSSPEKDGFHHPKANNLVLTSNTAYRAVHISRHLTQQDVIAMDPLERFDVLTRLQNHFETLLNNLQGFNKRPNEYSLSALHRSLDVVEKFYDLNLGVEPLAQTVKKHLKHVNEINKQYNFRGLTLNRQPTRP